MLKTDHPLVLSADIALQAGALNPVQEAYKIQWQQQGQLPGFYVVGKNTDVQNLKSAKVPILGVLDDNAKPDETWQGLPAMPFEAAEPDAWVVHCVTSIATVAVENRLTALGRRFISQYQFKRVCQSQGFEVPDLDMVRDQKADWNQNRDRWVRLYDQLADDASKQTMSDVLCFRLTGNAEYMRGYTIRLQDQYMEDFMEYHSEVFIDAGGFDGDTSEEFLKRYPDCKEIHLFEPSPVNLAKAKQRLAAFVGNSNTKLMYYDHGLSDQDEVLLFDAHAGSASAVVTQETDTAERIPVKALDQYLEVQPSLIKMDLEGWETKALAGCENMIRQYTPKLAIAVYHQPSDFWSIPEWVLQVNPNYTLYMRHYTQGWSETVLYFKPRGEGGIDL